MAMEKMISPTSFRISHYDLLFFIKLSKAIVWINPVVGLDLAWHTEVCENLGTDDQLNENNQSFTKLHSLAPYTYILL